MLSVAQGLEHVKKGKDAIALTALEHEDLPGGDVSLDLWRSEGGGREFR